jgi:23S rRNA pseudouridine1911/1915/1917 synthase
VITQHALRDMETERVITLTVAESESGRLDRFIAAQLTDQSRTAVQRLIDGGFITRNGSLCTAAAKIAPGDIIVVRILPPAPTEIIAEDIPLAIVYEDDDLMVIDKPAGLVVHPAAGHDHGTLVNAVLGYAPDIEGVGGEMRPGIVHRLDKDTSGLMIVAKNDRALRDLQQQFKSRTVKKMYVPIGRSQNHRKKMAVTHAGRSARTRYRVTRVFHNPDVSLVEAYPETGRTHQIRVHFAWLHHPLVGDTTYGRHTPLLELPRHFLHAASLTFTLPNGEVQTFTSTLPHDLQQVLDHLTSPEK